MSNTVIYVVSFVFPWALATWLLSLVLRPRKLAAIAALVVVIVPVGGIPIGRWLVSVNANFSIPFTVLVVLAAVGRITGRNLMTRREMTSAWCFGLVSGLLLYPMSIGLTDFDPYSLGWQPVLLVVATVSLVAILLAARNNLALVLIAVLLAYNLHLLESPNYWDYMVDPVYWLVSAGALLASLRRERSIMAAR